MEIATLETQLMGTMTGLAQMQNDFVDVVEENGMLQAQLGASEVLIESLQAEFDSAVMNELNLQTMVANLSEQLNSSNNEIAQLQAELGAVINDLVTQMDVGQNLQSILETQLADSESQISQLTTQIAGLQASLSIAQGQLEDNTINADDIAHYENQISSLVQTNQALVNTLHEMELQTGQTSADLGSGTVQVQGQINMETGKGVIQLLTRRPTAPARETKSTKSNNVRRLNFVAHNPKKDLNPWNYMDGEHRRFNNSYDLDN
jgi:chromosome segregation ATPase